MSSRNRGTPKEKLRNLSKAQLSYEQIDALLDALNEGKPLETAILGSSLIEHQLEVLIQSRLKNRNDETWNEITDESGPLGTFHRKILLSYSLGLIDERTKTNILILKSIRNAFAHTRILLDFDHPLIIQEMQKIVQPKGTKSKEAKRLLVAKVTGKGKRDAYVWLCFAIMGRLIDTKMKQAKKKANYYKKKSASRWSTYPGLGGLADLLIRQEESEATTQQPIPSHQSDDPTKLVQTSKGLGPLGTLFPNAVPKKD